MTRLALACAALVLLGCSAGSEQRPAAPAADDLRLVREHVESVHVDPWHDVPRAVFLDAVARLEGRLPELGRDELLVELMRLYASLGARDGHSGVYPLDPAHRDGLRLYPVRLFDFDDGLRVAAQVGGSGLVGARLLAVAGVDVERAAAAVRPLVPHDNEQSLRARVPQWLVVAEVLHGLGITESAGPAAFRFELPGGAVVERTLAPVGARRWREAFPDLFHPMVPQGLPRREAPAYLARRLTPEWTARLAGGRVAYVAYNVTLGSSARTAAALRRQAAARGVRGVVLDLRHNPGGENGAYEPLLAALRTLGRRERIAVIVSRTTFSAAVNLLADLERTTRVTIVGERSGGSPNLIGDPSSLSLPGTGWSANVGTVWWRKSARGPGDPRLAFEPDVLVPVRFADVAAGRDPALAAAIRAATA